MDTIADMLTQIRNASAAQLADVRINHSKMKEAIARILKQEGYVSECQVDGQGIKTVKVKLKYEGRRPVITGIRRISTPGLRRYVGSSEIPRVLGGMGIVILSTSKGLMTGRQARKENLGGEVLCYVW